MIIRLNGRAQLDFRKMRQAFFTAVTHQL
jgi:hypothetical protein